MAKVDIREIVTRKIIEGLEQGQIPWVKGWRDGMAVNHVTGKSYRGLNQLSLSYVAENKGWINRWVSIGLIRKNEWRIKAGESPQYIAFFKWVTKEEDDGSENTFPLLRYYKVWSISQLEDELEVPEPEEFNPIDKAESVISNMPQCPNLNFGGNQPAYNPLSDTVRMPLQETFFSPDEYYSTFYHELAHSTGHEKRLNRELSLNFGSEEYGLEELVAEFTAAFLCAESGIENTIKNSTAYVQNWLKVLKNDRQMLLTAASLAQKASDFILGVTWDN